MKSESMLLEPNTTIPSFALQNQHDETITEESLKNRLSIVYFYPKDSTPGCTAEACSLRDAYSDLQHLGLDVYGVSKDSVTSHKKFADKQKLPFHLLSDPEASLIKAFGAWGPKKFMGKSFEGILRSTFIIGPDLKIQHIIDKVDTTNHADQIKKILEK